jgi:hypothetical protein
VSTYSTSVTGVSAGHKGTVQLLTLSDANASAGAQKQAMAQGTHFLCKRPDGSEAYYRLDAERSRPDYPVLIATRP